MRYRLGQDFAGLDAHCTADITGLYLPDPFVHSRTINVNGHSNTNASNSPMTPTAVPRKPASTSTGGLGLSGDRLDGCSDVWRRSQGSAAVNPKIRPKSGMRFGLFLPRLA